MFSVTYGVSTVCGSFGSYFSFFQYLTKQCRYCTIFVSFQLYILQIIFNCSHPVPWICLLGAVMPHCEMLIYWTSLQVKGCCKRNCKESEGIGSREGGTHLCCLWRGEELRVGPRNHVKNRILWVKFRIFVNNGLLSMHLKFLLCLWCGLILEGQHALGVLEIAWFLGTVSWNTLRFGNLFCGSVLRHQHFSRPSTT